MSNPVTEARLAELYARMLNRRRSTSAEPAVPVETIQALAGGTYSGPDRISLLDKVLGDPGMAAEFQVFRDLAAAAPVPMRRARPGLLALAAGIGVIGLAGLLWTLRPGEREPEQLRSGNGGPELIAPTAGASLGAGDRLLWRSVPDATQYRVEIADNTGAVILTETLRDTAATVPDSVHPAPGARYLWWVTATRSDGTSRRAAPVAVTGRTP